MPSPIPSKRTFNKVQTSPESKQAKRNKKIDKERRSAPLGRWDWFLSDWNWVPMVIVIFCCLALVLFVYYVAKKD